MVADVTLRQLVETAVMNLGSHTARELEKLCPGLGLTLPEADSKAKRLAAGMAVLADPQLPGVAKRLLEENLVSALTRYAIEDLLWAAEGAVEITMRVRRDIAGELDLDDLVHRSKRFQALLDDLWLPEPDLFAGLLGAPPRGLRGEITQHVYDHSDWSAEYLFEQLGVFDAGDTRFARFLEGLLAPANLPDEPTQRRVAEAINLHLRSAGAELTETGIDGGYPLFRVVPIGIARNRSPKNLIFATLEKPDIRFRNAVDNDIEYVGNPDALLLYDKPISNDGMRWADLQQWWQDTHGIADDMLARTSLYERLGRSLPRNSPAQRNLFDLYHDIHDPDTHLLPALLPEIWLHWDPKTVRERGRDAMVRFRMDFLLLLPYGQRIVLEVDGPHHYANKNGWANPAKYDAGVRGDRELRLSGYEVFRFGADELTNRAEAEPLLRQFFQELFRRFKVKSRPSKE